MGQQTPEIKNGSGEKAQSTMEALKKSKGDPEAAAMNMLSDKLPEGVKSTMEAIRKAKRVAQIAEIAGAVVASPGCCIIFVVGALFGIAQGIIGEFANSTAGHVVTWFASWVSDGFGDIVAAVKNG
jgi:hypothetical protein